MRRLAEHPKLGVSATTVHRAVRIYELWLRHGKPGWKHLGVSHLRPLLGLSDDDQHRLITQAEDMEWTAERLAGEAAKARKKIVDGRGRPPLPRFVKSIHQVGKHFADPDDSFGDMDALDEIPDDEALELYESVTVMKAKMDELYERLQKRVTPTKA